MAPDESKEIMSQEDIDDYINSVKTKEEGQEKNNQAMQQEETLPKESKRTEGETESVSQDDIDALLSQARTPPQNETEEKPTQPKPDAINTQPQEDSGNLSQDDIDAQPQEDPGNISQDDIDALISQAQTPPQNETEENPTPPKTDAIDAQPQPAEPTEEQKNTWEELDNNILSQQEIDALLSGFNDVPDSTNIIDAETSENEKDRGPQNAADDIIPLDGKNLVEGLRKREENIIQKKKIASNVLRELLKTEEARIRSVRAKKDKMINEDLYTRFEITRADRTKMVVSMSAKTAKDYKSMNPGACMHKI